jgi:hypothetical protein
MIAFEHGEVRVYAKITVIYTDVSRTKLRVEPSRRRAERHEREAYWKIFG